ncbi:hypothetical protein HYW74_02395 [Candidatus Pacearchaeota archaeon]|nr:hypothetical protein [Candidatus Pacearchaeota archaeon]
MKKRKKKLNKFLILAIIILAVILIYAFSYAINNQNIGLSPSQPTQVKINVGNAQPTITNLQAIPNVNLNPSPSTTSVLVTFTARDANGANDLVDATASAQFTNTGEPTRTGTCSMQSSAGKEKTYQCSVSMNYYDKSGAWTATVSVADTKAATAQSSSTLTVNLLRDISISPAIINFPSVAPEDINILSTDNTLITNNGNFEAPPGAILATAYNLIGETDASQNIPAANFKVAGLSQPDVCGLGNSLVHASSTAITTSTLPRGAAANTETLSYCLTSVPEISSQAYSATGGSSWVIAIN